MRLLDIDHSVALLPRKLDLGDHVSADQELFISAVGVAVLTHGAHRSAH